MDRLFMGHDAPRWMVV